MYLIYILNDSTFLKYRENYVYNFCLIPFLQAVQGPTKSYFSTDSCAQSNDCH